MCKISTEQQNRKNARRRLKAANRGFVVHVVKLTEEERRTITHTHIHRVSPLMAV